MSNVNWPANEKACQLCFPKDILKIAGNPQIQCTPVSVTDASLKSCRQEGVIIALYTDSIRCLVSACSMHDSVYIHKAAREATLKPLRINRRPLRRQSQRLYVKKAAAVTQTAGSQPRFLQLAACPAEATNRISNASDELSSALRLLVELKWVLATSESRQMHGQARLIDLHLS